MKLHARTVLEGKGKVSLLEVYVSSILQTQQILARHAFFLQFFQECGKRKSELEEEVKGLKTEVSAEETALKKTGRSVEVLGLQLEALRERERELEREKREGGGSKLDTAHLKKLEGRVKTFEKGERGKERERKRKGAMRDARGFYFRGQL